MTTRKDGEATREKLLEAAAQVFGERGFVKATHAEICRLAGVNTALINFHFGSKDALYRAVWERVTADVERRYPLNGGVPPAAPAADRLHGHIRTLLHRALDPHLEGFHRLRTMEFVHPTGMLDAALTANLQRHRNYLRALLRDLLGPAITERALDLCEMSVISQCLMIMPPPGRGKRKPPLRFVHADVEELAAHITRFSLAGLDVQREARAERGIGW
jgi:AcrR family transcriptional regulator